MRDLYTEIKEDGYEDTTVGAGIVDTFFNGNFTDGVKQLLEINISAREFLNYVESESEGMGHEDIKEFANGHFSPDFWLSLGEQYLNIARGGE